MRASVMARCRPRIVGFDQTFIYEHLAACDLALVQGGLTTRMKLVASGRPFCPAYGAKATRKHLAGLRSARVRGEGTRATLVMEGRGSTEVWREGETRPHVFECQYYAAR